MAKKLKRPDGSLIEEFICASFHVFRNGKLDGTINDVDGGDYSATFHSVGLQTPGSIWTPQFSLL
jgi:hypothetical protein